MRVPIMDYVDDKRVAIGDADVDPITFEISDTSITNTEWIAKRLGNTKPGEFSIGKKKDVGTGGVNEEPFRDKRAPAASS